MGQLYQVSDLNHEEAMNYLCEKRGIDVQDAEKMYSLVGGRIMMLETTGDKLKEMGQTWQCLQCIFIKVDGLLLIHFIAAIMDELLNMTESIFLKFGMLPGGENEVGWNIATHILKHGFIDYGRYYKTIRNGELADRLLAANVFSHDLASHKITFKSGIIETFVQQKIAEHEKEAKKK
jgi:hypothetical protein